MDRAIVMTFPRGAVSRCSQSRRCNLQSCIVRNRESPVGWNTRVLGRAEIAFNDSQQPVYLFLATFVLGQPAVTKPILQAHFRLRG
jgi:hypothetical protein